MTRRRAYFWAFVVITCLLAIAALAYQTANVRDILPANIVRPSFYRVVEVHDGDTISVDMNGQVERVRMIGVDTPETHDPDTPVQCYGQEASDFTKRVLSKTVRLEADPKNDNRDRYGRLLRYVYTEQATLVERALIQEGYGFAYLSFPFERSAEFALLQDQARHNNLGLWASCLPTQKNDRWQSNPL